jgi:hypothetical protein
VVGGWWLVVGICLLKTKDVSTDSVYTVKYILH